jgi:hypothetical protein
LGIIAKIELKYRTKSRKSRRGAVLLFIRNRIGIGTWRIALQEDSQSKKCFIFFVAGTSEKGRPATKVVAGNLKNTVPATLFFFRFRFHLN